MKYEGGTSEKYDPQKLRWTAARKRDVVHRLEAGELTREEAMRKYGLSEAELASWEERARLGVDALKQKAVRAFHAG
jgi:hypothetical protein